MNNIMTKDEFYVKWGPKVSNREGEAIVDNDASTEFILDLDVLITDEIQSAQYEIDIILT